MFTGGQPLQHPPQLLRTAGGRNEGTFGQGPIGSGIGGGTIG